MHYFRDKGFSGDHQSVLVFVGVRSYRYAEQQASRAWRRKWLCSLAKKGCTFAKFRYIFIKIGGNDDFVARKLSSIVNML